jgi:predicted nucleic acid-binding protein
LIIIDASAVIELLLRTELGEKVEVRALARDARLHGPHLLDLEILQALRRLLQLQAISVARAGEALLDYADLFIERASHQPLLGRIWQLRESMTAYDGAYVALAEALDAPVVTCDEKLARSHGHRASIELIE